MNHALIRLLPVSLALFGAIPLAYASDPDLLGCWRSQNSDQYGSDGRTIHLNGDCVSEFSLKQIRTECQNSNGRVNNISTYEVTAPGRYVATISEGISAAKEPPQPRAIEYVVDGEWLTLTSIPQKRINAQPPVPDKVVGLAVRVNTSSGKDVCHPRGPSKIRVGSGPVSSLLLTVPEAFVPVLKDPFSDPELAKGINSNFLIGQFVPEGSAKASPAGMPIPGRGYVLVVEDSRTGSRPMKPADFRQFKVALKQEIGQDKVSCEDERKLCFNTAHSVQAGGASQRTQDSRLMTTEFVNVKGRIAIIFGMAFGGTPEDLKAARRSADIFADRILRDNP